MLVCHLCMLLFWSRLKNLIVCLYVTSTNSSKIWKNYWFVFDIWHGLYLIYFWLKSRIYLMLSIPYILLRTSSKHKKSRNETRIEPVGKPYREVCLQTLLWPWKVHRPSSWSLFLSELALKLKVFFFFFSLNGFFGLYWTYFQQMN